MAIDFFGIALSGRIHQFATDRLKDSEDKVVDLWLGDNSSVLTKDLGALAFVSEINVNMKMGDNVSISLVLTPPFEEALIFMQSDLCRYGNGRLEVTLGYTTGDPTGPGSTMTTLPFSGFLQKPDVSIGSDITITLHALGVGYQANEAGGAETKSFDVTMSPADAVKTTLEKYASGDGATTGLKIDNLYKYIDASKQDKNSGDLFFRVPTANVLPVSSKPVSLSEDLPGETSSDSQFPDAPTFTGVVHKGPRNDWWFIRETVQEYGYDLFMEGNELCIVDKSFWMKSQYANRKAMKHFWLRGIVDPSRNIYPILSFQSPTDNVWIQPGVGQLLCHDVDPSKQSENGTVHSASASVTPIVRSKPSLGDLLDNLDNSIAEDVAHVNKANASDANNKLLASLNFPGDPNNPQVQKKLEAHWTDLNYNGGVQGIFGTIGIPDLTPGDVIQADGFNPIRDMGGSTDKAIYNGPYGIVEVNHKIGVGGWDTSFHGIMGLFPRAFQDAAQQALVQPTADKPPVSSFGVAGSQGDGSVNTSESTLDSRSIDQGDSVASSYTDKIAKDQGIS